jgi:hypothetical protein
MAKRRAQRDFVDHVAEWLAHNKGMPVFVGAGLVLVNLVLSLIPALSEAGGFMGWLMQSDLLLHLGVIVGLLGILLGDAL